MRKTYSFRNERFCGRYEKLVDFLIDKSKNQYIVIEDDKRFGKRYTRMDMETLEIFGIDVFDSDD